MATTGAGHVIVAAETRNSSTRVYQGVLAKYDGATGTSVWVHDFPEDEVKYLYNIEAVDETVYLTGSLQGADIDPFNTGTYVSSSNAGGDHDAFIASLDVSGWSKLGAPNWVVQVGQGIGYSVKAVGEHLYVAGYLYGPSTMGTCTMSGDLGGYLAKLSRATGACEWARDTPRIRRAVSDGSHVWTVVYENDPMTFDATHTISPIGEYDTFIGKYQASDGTALWAAAIGGTGRDLAYDAAMTPTGPVFAGRSDSEAITVGSLTINNLQHQREEAATGVDEARSGEYALMAIKLSLSDQLPACVSSCPSGELTGAGTTIASGSCYVNDECVADGDTSVATPCLMCNSGTSQTELMSVCPPSLPPSSPSPHSPPAPPSPPSPPFAPSAPPQLAPLGSCSSCDAVCALDGHFCHAGLQAALRTADRVLAAFSGAGFACGSVSTGCESTQNSDCARWGAPYVHSTSTACVFGSEPATCDTTPFDCHHRRVCMCSLQPPSPPSSPPQAEFDKCARPSGTWAGFDQVDAAPPTRRAHDACTPAALYNEWALTTVARSPAQGRGASFAYTATYHSGSIYIGGFA